MPRNKEDFNNLPNSSGPETGGSLFAYTDEGGIVAYTRHGEMVGEILDDGSLLTSFPEFGLIYQYLDDGSLATMSVNLRPYLSSMNAKEVETMPCGGKKVLDFLRWMIKEKVDFYVTIMFDEKIMEITMADLLSDEDPEVVRTVSFDNLRQSMSGVFGVKGEEMSFEITDYGDDLLVAFGESDGKRTKLVGVESSLNVNYEAEMFGDDPKRMQRLAAKIILT